MSTSTLTSKGQTTIPKRIREFLHVEPGDRLEFIIDSDGRVIIRPRVTDLRALDGMLDRSASPPISVDDMHKAVEKTATALYKKSR